MKQYSALTALIVTVVAPVVGLLPVFGAWSKACTQAEIAHYLEQLSQLNTPAIQRLIECDQPAVPGLVQALNSSNDNARASAAYALGNIGRNPEIVIPKLIEILDDRDRLVRTNAAFALGDFGIKDRAATSTLLTILAKDADGKTRSAAAYALGKVSGGDKNIISALIKALDDSDNEVRNNAAYALGDFGVRARDAVQPLIEILKDQIQAKDVRAGAAYALGKVDGHNKEIVAVLRNTLKDGDVDVRGKSAASLGDVAQALYDDAQTIQQVDVALATTQELVKGLETPEFEQYQKSIKRIVSNLTDRKNILQAQARLEWFAIGRRIWLNHALFWLILVFVYPKSSQIQAIFFWNPWVRTILGFGYVSFLLTWIPFLRSKLFAPFRFSLLADAGLNHFQPDTYFSESNVRELAAGDEQPIMQVIPEIKGQVILEGDSGLGKTMFLRHLLQQSKRIVVYLPATKCAEGVIEAIQKKLHGDEIKDTKFLQSLIYSGAIDICIDGLNEVNPDTRAKITQFVESHFKGNILMTTQPLEWLPPSTAKTYVMQPLQSAQIERYLRSRQPSLPKAAPVQGTAYEQACRTFLDTMLSNQKTSLSAGTVETQAIESSESTAELPPSPQVWGNQTAQSPPRLGDLGGAKELHTANLSSLSPEELKTARTILSNPMELTLAAWMLAGGVQPDLFNLREQQYKLMAEEYRRTWNQDFPLKQFSEAVYQQWLVDQKALPADKFYNELLCMEDEKFRMVVSRQWRDAKGDAKKEWYFRHDKIAEFFLVQTFLGKGTDAETRLLDHIGDSRFRGVYFLLATLMDLEAAKDLREKLIQYAADTKDHTVSDTFVQLLRSR